MIISSYGKTYRFVLVSLQYFALVKTGVIESVGAILEVSFGRR